MKINLQPSQPLDLDLFVKIRTSVMREHVERLHAWDEAGEINYARSVFNHETMQRILVDDGVVGYINLRPADYSTISLGLFCIKKGFQNNGIGTEVMARVLSQSPCTEQCVFLNVLKGSPAVNLYRRFDFEYSHSDSISDYFKRLPR